MKGMFDASVASEIKQRLGRLQQDSPRQWGKMNPAQAVAHCAKGMEAALGDAKPPRMLIGRILGPIFRPIVIDGERPMKPGAPTSPELLVKDERNLDKERARLRVLIDRMQSGGATAVTTHPHQFFGSLTPDQWAILVYKHLDHHLRQFAV